MFDGPSSPDFLADYVENVRVPLAKGEGVACFLVDDRGERRVLFCSHRLSERAGVVATDPSGLVRAAQAVAIQREARVRAAEAGFVEWTGGTP